MDPTKTQQYISLFATTEDLFTALSDLLDAVCDPDDNFHYPTMDDVNRTRRRLKEAGKIIAPNTGGNSLGNVVR